MQNKKITTVLYILMLFAGIYSSPKNDVLEITAQLCQFADAGNQCSCSDTPAIQKGRIFYQ